MDPRTARTRSAILNAFIALRARRPLEKITVKELSQAAGIHKATFYLHYQDIYDLSDRLEDQLLDQLLQTMDRPSDLILRPAEGMAALFQAVEAQGALFHTLFSGSRRPVLVDKLERRAMALAEASYPALVESLEGRVVLTALIQGNFHAFLRYQDQDSAQAAQTLGKLNQCVSDHYPGGPGPRRKNYG